MKNILPKYLYLSTCILVLQIYLAILLIIHNAASRPIKNSMQVENKNNYSKYVKFHDYDNSNAYNVGDNYHENNYNKMIKSEKAIIITNYNNLSNIFHNDKTELKRFKEFNKNKYKTNIFKR